jgi:diguanylate cyclase (GGDEF)-like protein
VRLQLKLALVLVPLVAGPVLALGWVSYDALRQDLEDTAVQSLDTTLDAAAQGLRGLVDAARANSALFAAAGPVERYARAADDQERTDLLQAPLLKLFHQYRDAYPEYQEIRLLRPDGTMDIRVAATERPAQLPAGGAEPGFASVQADPGPVSERLILDAWGGGGALYVYRRIALADHYLTRADDTLRTRGYLVLRVSLDPLFEWLRALPVAASGRLILAFPAGDVLFDSSGAWTGRRLPSALLHPEPVSAHADRSGSRPAGIRIWDTSPWLVRVRFIEPGILALAALPEHSLATPLRRLGLTTLIMTGFAVLLLITALIAWLRRLVLRPLAVLRDAAGRIGAGELRTSIPIHSADEIGALAAAVRVMGEDLADRREQIELLAFHDPLTGLPNRRLIRELLGACVAAAAGADGYLAVLFLDLDNFKQINDALGHAQGDELLRGVARRLENVSAPPASRVHLSRFGGDEFLIVADRLSGPDQAADLAQAMLDAAVQPSDLGGAQYIVTASIGITLYPRDAADADGLIRCADLAMYGAKAMGRNTLHFFSAELDHRVAARLQTESQLRLALGRGELTLHYQPIVHLASGRLAGFEALLRWQNAVLGWVPPGQFIPVAEETGLIREIGRWVLAEVCRQIAAWRLAGLVTVPVSVNVSGGQLQRESLAETVSTLLAEHGLSAADIHLEITESVLMEQTLHDTGRLQALRALGLAIHIDDFGTGYSSLGYLQQLSVDCIKIDRSFVARLCTVDGDRTLVTAMITLAHALRLRVIAEGVETAEQLAVLRALDCDLGQGYWFARPAEAAVAVNLLSMTAGSPVIRRASCA